MRFLTTLLAALALAGMFVAPVGAADRPVGPETGQARTGGGGGGNEFPREPDGAEAFDRFGLPGQGETGLSWGEFWCRVIYVWGGDTSGSRC